MNQDLDTVERYAHELGATVHFTVPRENTGGSSGPRANSLTREVWSIPLDAGSPDQNSESFWATMHELGHIAMRHRGQDPFAMLFGDANKAELEAEAWVWAIDHAGRPLDAPARASITFSLSSYIYSQGEPNIGPNLRRIFREVGPDFDESIAHELFLGQDGANIPTAAKVWAKYASPLAAAA